jgi:hypothetical protein
MIGGAAMKRVAHIGLIVLASLTLGCSRPQPTPPSSETTSAETAAIVEDSDSAAIAAHADVVKRDGESLILFVSGKPVARTHNIRTKDCEGFDSCFDWKFEGIVSVRDTPGGPLMALPVISSLNWEGTDYAIIDALGRAQWLSSSPLASPDGCFIANGNQADVLSDGYLAVTDWCGGYPRKQRYAYPPCEPRQWGGVDTLSLSCREEGEPQEFPAQAKRQADGTWLITPPKAQPDMITQENLRLKPAEKPLAPPEGGSRKFGIEALKP